MAKVLLINGSPHANGCTAAALEEMISVFKTEGVETELVRVGSKAIRGCVRHLTAHLLDIRHHPAHTVLWNDKARLEDRLQQHASAALQAILDAHRRRDYEIQRVRVHQMVVPADQRYVHVGHLPAQPPLAQCLRNRLLNLVLVSGHYVP